MKALILCPFHEESLKDLSVMMPTIYESWTDTQKLYDPYDLANRICTDNINIVIIEADFLFKEFFDVVPRLELVGVCRSGLNHIDVEAATENNVVVINTPGRNAMAVGEFVIGLMLSLLRHIPKSDRYIKEGKWNDPIEPYYYLRGNEINGKTLGIVGLGATGLAVAKLAQSMGMKVVGTDPNVSTAISQKHNISQLTLDQLLETSHVVSLHLPYTTNTKNLINSNNIHYMKSNSYLINVSAAELVDQNALLNSLTKHKIAGAAIDVHESHPIPNNNPLIELDNVILTPHIAGSTHETIQTQSSMIVEDIKRFSEGIRPTRIVNPEIWIKHER
tara:strand:- start:539 stop:1537 length:999 start_codon:yes stop_codon:yes gene_type:complete